VIRGYGRRSCPTCRPAWSVSSTTSVLPGPSKTTSVTFSSRQYAGGRGWSQVFGGGEVRDGWVWIRYTPEVDMLFVRLIDMLVYVRQSAPQVVQLRLVK
jgi:hypothetical protein